MATEIAQRIEASKSKAALTRREKAANREAVKELAAKHMEAAIKKLGDIVADKNAPASAKVAAATQLLDRVAGKPKFQDDRETEQGQLEKMSTAELVRFICDQISHCPSQARAAIAEALLAAEQGLTVDVRDMDFNESELEVLPPLEPKRPKKEPRR